MNQAYKKILLAVAPQEEALATFETAATLARQHGASITVFDTVRPPSRSATFFSTHSGDVFEMIVADKQQRIRRVTQRLQEMGLSAQGKLLFGRSSEVITQEVMAQDASLLIRHGKGAGSRYRGNYGNTARNLMRICPCPILFVAENALENPKVMACVNPEHHANENSAILQEAAKLVVEPEHLSGLYCWNVAGQPYLQHYLSEDVYQDTVRESEKIYRNLFNDFCKKHQDSECKDRLLFEHGEPATVIPEICVREEIDIVVMSSASQTHPLRRLLGSTIESVLDHLPCALLVVKQLDFNCPVKPARNPQNESVSVASV